MIINNNVIKHEVVEDDFLTIQSKVNKNKLVKLYGLLSNIYRNPIGAIVREYASNAYDANVEGYNFANSNYNEITKKYSWVKNPNFNLDEVNFNKLKKNLNKISETEPVIVGIREDANQLYFYVKDYGIGLSPERMRFIYFNYLDSTKEDNNDEIGGFGIGSKSALSYTHTFFIDTVYNGILYKYIMSKDRLGIPQGQLLYKGEYDENLENGTTIKIKLKENFDANHFIEEIHKQLSYMDNLFIDLKYYDNNGSSLMYDTRKTITNVNDFNIYKHNDWLKKDKNQLINQMHLCLGKIAYTIDWTELNMEAIKYPIALKFEVGELEPTPSRESIIYGKESVELIKNRITKVKKYFADKYKLAFSPTNDFGEYLDLRNHSNIIFEINNNIKVNLHDLFGYTNGETLINDNNVTYIPFNNAGITYVPYNSFFAYESFKRINGNSAKINVSKYSNNINSIISNPNKLYFFNKNKINLSFHRNAYLLEDVLKTQKDIFIIEKDSEVDIKDFKSSFTLLTDTDNEILKKFKVFNSTIDNYLESISVEYEKYYPNPNWELSFKAGKSIYSPNKKKVLEGKIFCYTPNTYGGFHQDNVDLKSLSNHNGLIIYDEHSNKNELSIYYRLLKQTKSFRNTSNYNGPLKCMSVSKANLKYLKQIENAMTPKEIFTKVRTFKRISTALFIKDRFNAIRRLYKLTEVNCYEVLNTKYRIIDDYINNNCKNVVFNDIDSISKNFKEGMLMMAGKHNMIDENIVKDLEFLEEYDKGLDMLDLMYSSIDEEHKDIIVEYLKLKNKRVSSVHYLKKPEL